jgi:hypothetical protein
MLIQTKRRAAILALVVIFAFARFGRGITMIASSSGGLGAISPEFAEALELIAVVLFTGALVYWLSRRWLRWRAARR